MIIKENCLLLGNIAKPHGTRGSMLLWLKSIKAEEIKKWDTVFVDIDGLLVPFFIESFVVSAPETMILKFEGIDSETKAKTFAGLSVFVMPDQIRKKKKSLTEFPTLEGYTVKDIKHGLIGIAGEIADIANNPLLVVVHDDKEFLIPLHEDIILEVNDKDREIIVDAPEGLFEL
jgi:16S rRNA processing protein RimM